MTQIETGAQELTRQECLALLRAAPFGRLVFTQGALPAVLPVNFVVDTAGIVLRTSALGSIGRAVDASVVAFQGDDVDLGRRTGWAVTVIGQARVVRDPLEIARLSELPLDPWVPGDRDTFVVVELGIVTGRRIGGPEPVRAAAATPDRTGAALCRQ